jgi:hypothetical protein
MLEAEDGQRRGHWIQRERRRPVTRLRKKEVDAGYLRLCWMAREGDMHLPVSRLDRVNQQPAKYAARKSKMSCTEL